MQFYDFAFERKPDDPLINLNKAAALLKLGRFFEAYQAVERAISDDNSIVNTDPKLKYKALFRLGQAAYGIRDRAKSMQVFSEINDESGSHWLAKSRQRLNEAQTGSFDMKALGTSIGTLVHHDVADFVGDVEIVDIPGKGRGLCTTKDIPARKLLLASKAFATGSPRKGVLKTDMIMGLVAAESRVIIESDFDLIGNAVCALRNNPQRASELYRLYAGKLPRTELPDGIIDPGRVEGIVAMTSLQFEDLFGLDRLPVMTEHSGIFTMPAFINHSCIENADRICYGDVMMVRAERDLRAGEEIVLNYCGSFIDNRQTLKGTWQIDCGCPLCQERDRTPDQAIARRESLLASRPSGMKGGQRLSQIEHWVRILDATYKPDDRFKREMMVPLLDLMEACVQAGKKEQAIAAGRRIIEIEPRIPPGATVLTMMTIARLYFETRRTDRAREELRMMRDYWWKRAGITLSQLKVVAKQAMEEGDPSRVLTEILRDVDEEASPAAS